MKKGDRIGLVALNCHEFLLLYGAAAKIGAIVLPVNWRFQAHEVEYVFKDTTPKMVFAGPEYRLMVDEIAERVSSIERCYTIGGGEVVRGFRPLGDLYGEGRGSMEEPISADDGFVIIHTAAVGGEPRGALLSQSNVIHCNVQMMFSNGLVPEDCFVCILPLFHIAALSMAMAVMHAGGKNVIVERFDPELTLRLIHQEKGTHVVHFEPILQMLIQKYEESGGAYDLSSIQSIEIWVL